MDILKNENGAMMMLVTVMFLVLLTVISIAASRTATIETKIAANEYAYQSCFYLRIFAQDLPKRQNTIN